MAGSISAQEITERIRQASDIVDVVSAHVTLKRAGRNLRGLCPFHGEKTPSFNVTPERQTFKCFGCGVGGDVFKFVQLRENVGFVEARAILASRAGISLDEPRANGTPTTLGKVEIERVNRWAAAWFKEQYSAPGGSKARQYVSERGITSESVEKFGLGYAPESWDSLINAARAKKIPVELLMAAGLIRQRDQGGHYDAYRDRLIFPIQDAMNRIIGFGGRTLGDDSAKYINSPQNALFDKSRCLYGLTTAKDAFASNGSAILVEGYIDCIMAQQFGFQNAVATLGTALTAEHVRVLRRYVETVVLVFDADEAGRRAADAALPLFLTEQVDVRLTQVPEGKDPADYLLAAGAASFAKVLTSSVGALESKWKQVLRQYAADSGPAGRRKAVEEFLGLVARGADFGTLDPIQRGLVLNQVGKLLGITTEEVNRQLRITGRKLSAPGVLRSASAREDRIARPLTAVQDSASSAMRHLLEVVVCEPSYYELVAEEFDARLLADEELRSIAAAVVELAEQEGGLTLTGLLGRFESVATSSRIMQLHAAGEQRKNFEANIAGALESLRREREYRSYDEMTTALRTGSPFVAPPLSGPAPEVTTGQNESDELIRLRALNQMAARRPNHFAAQKHLATPMTVGAEPGAQRGAE